MNAVKKTLLKITIDSLENRPDDWKFELYQAKNPKLGITIWMANRFYGTNIESGCVSVGGQDGDRGWFHRWQPWRRNVVRLAEKIACDRLVAHVDSVKALQSKLETKA